MNMLECKNLSLFYGQHHALDQISLNVKPGEIVTILGANGAGKSSLLKAIAGVVSSEPNSQVRMDGIDITDMPAHEVVEAGLALVPEGRGIFGELTVIENLRLGSYPERANSSEATNLDRVFTLFPKLNERKNQVVRTMSGGEQQMVAIGRAIMSAPTILMLDEPSLGLSPLLCSELFRTMKEIRKTGTGILLVEQNAKQSLAIADRGYLLEVGRIVGQDTAHHLMSDPAVKKAYLGGSISKPVISSEKNADLSVKDKDTLTNNTAADKYTIIPRLPSQETQNSSQIIPEEISKIVSRAVEVENKHQKISQKEQKTAPPSHMLTPSSSLQNVINDIEQSARSARYTPGLASIKAEPGEKDHKQIKGKPIIEIYKKPKIEIYKRNKSSSAMKLIKIAD
tara:strand:- start:920 stop:2110 length:1191 start_codon:yes stop_codon:yes gene_type:complete